MYGNNKLNVFAHIICYKYILCAHIKEKQLEEFDKKILSLKQQEMDYYPDAEKIALHYNRSAHVAMMNMLRFRAIIKEVVARKRYDGDEHLSFFKVEFSRLL